MQQSRPPVRAVLPIAALAVFTVWITWRAKALEMGLRLETASSQMVGKPAPDFALESLDGQKISVASYHGKTLVAAFWASWCGPCRLELPLLVKLYQQTHKPDSGFEILAISIDQKKDDAQGAARTLKIPFPVLLDPESHVADTYKVDAIPTLFLIDRAGKVTYTHTGYAMGLDFILAQQLGISNYTPTGGTR
jgi:peroxiredoxin